MGKASLRFSIVRQGVSVPLRGSPLAAGVDLAAAESTVVSAGGSAEIKTGLKVHVPQGAYARIAPRSGLAAKHMIDVGAGVINADDTEELKVLLYNHGLQDFNVSPLDRVAQLLVERVATPACDIAEVDALTSTERGEGGFGSTGVAGAVAAGPDGPVQSSGQSNLGTSNKIFVKRLTAGATVPKRLSPLGAGIVVAASENTVVPSNGKAIVKTGLSMALPVGTYARCAPLTSLAKDHMLKWGAGVIDSDYRGEIGVVLFNFGTQEVSFAPGDDVAQLVLQEISQAPCKEVPELDATARGSGGFGSTGVKRQLGEEAVAESEDTPAEPFLCVKRLSPESTMPKRGSAEAAGFDLAASEATTVPAHGKAIVKTGLAVATPPGTYARIAPRSGLAAKKMIHCGAGVVDADYRGEVGVVLFNHGPEDFAVAVGDRIAQLILEKALLLPVEDVTAEPTAEPAAKRACLAPSASDMSTSYGTAGA
mmetsp:Transcript_41398/g.74983  ORF Transcript_41398/g.74983 Transcript_41398/m.74983 type:complete len:480 (-) Transcript_41398:64-1503(-)